MTADFKTKNRQRAALEWSAGVVGFLTVTLIILSKPSLKIPRYSREWFYRLAINYGQLTAGTVAGWIFGGKLFDALSPPYDVIRPNPYWNLK